MHPVAILGAFALMSRSFVTAADPTCATSACTWSQNAPEDGFWCRLIGVHESATVYRESLDTHPLQRNNLECGAVCSVLPNCKSSTFSASEGRCLFADKPGNYDFTTADAPDAWSDQTCFDCQCLTYTQPSTGPACDLPTCVTGEIESHVCFYPGNSFPASYSVPTSQYPQQDSFEACAAICLKLDGCKSSTWAGGNSCLFAKSSPNQAFWEGNGSDLSWSENECFICQCPSATTTTTSTQAASTPFGSPCSPASCVPVAETHYECNVEGRIHQTSYTLNPDDFPQQNSFEDCAVLCHKTEACKSSTFDGNYCYFANELPSSAFMRGDSYPVFWSENSCFNCPGCAARVVTTTTTASTTSSTPSPSPPATCAIETCEWGNFAGNNLCGYGGGQHRTAYAADKTLYPHQSTFEECAAICRKLPGCKSSVWSGNNDCLFANEEPNQAFVEWLGPNPSDLWWNSNTCFDCACPVVTTTTSSTTTTSTTSTTTTQATSTGPVTCSNCALIENFSDYTCLYMGTYHAKGYTVSRDQFPRQSDWETCNAVCRAVPGCKSSTSDGSKCLLANELPNESFQIVAGSNPSDLFWSETRCFSCDCTEVQPVTTTTTSTTTAPQATCSSPVCSLTIRDGNPDQCFYMGTEHRTAYRAPSQNKLPQNSYEECGAICLTLPGCKSSTMIWTGVCMFANEEPSEAFWDGQGNDLFWSPNRCFSCQCSDATSITTTTTTTTTPTPTPSPQNACNIPTCDFIPENPYMDKCYYMGTKHRTAYTAPYETYPQQDTYELCAAICSKLPGCKSSTWGGGNRCYFANELPSEAFWDVPNNDWSGLSDMFWSDTRCFNCQCPGAQAVSTTTTTSTPTPTPSSPSGCDAPTCTWIDLDANRDKCLRMGNEYPRKAYSVSRDLYPEQNSWIECVVVCSKLPNCKTSSHDGSRCLLVDEVWSESFWEGDGSDTFWSDNSCINCQCPNVEPATTTTTSTTTSPTSQAECQNIGCRRDYDAGDNNLCHYRGTFSTAYETSVDNYPLQNTEDQCAAVCAQLPGCVFSAYSPQLGHCKFANDETHYENFRPASIATGGIFWSQKQCYSCTTCASLPPLPSTPVSHCKNIGCKLKPESETQGKACHYHGLYGIAYESWMNKRADSAVDCAGICAQLRDCKASAWHPEYEVCVFANDDIGTGTWWSFPSELPSAAIDYYAQECYNCGPCPTEPVTPSDPVETPVTPVETPSTPVNPVQTPTNPVTPVETPTETPGTGGACNGDVMHHYGDYIACGISGQAGNQVQSYRLPNYVSVPAATLWECANICLGRPDCQGFDYHKYTYECKPYTTGVMNLGLTYIPTEWTRFYDRSCFRCA